MDIRIGNKEMLILPSVKPTENLNLKDRSCVRRIDGQVRLGERTLICGELVMRNRLSSKKVAQEVAKKLWNYKEPVAKKLIEPDN